MSDKVHLGCDDPDDNLIIIPPPDSPPEHGDLEQFRAFYAAMAGMLLYSVLRGYEPGASDTYIQVSKPPPTRRRHPVRRRSYRRAERGNFTSSIPPVRKGDAILFVYEGL